MTYPIEPGSDLDHVLNTVAARATGDGPPPGDFVMFKLIDPWNPGHMRALGLRTQMHAQGVTDPANVTAALYAVWFGGEPDKSPQ